MQRQHKKRDPENQPPGSQARNVFSLEKSVRFFATFFFFSSLLLQRESKRGISRRSRDGAFCFVEINKGKESKREKIARKRKKSKEESKA